MAVVCICYIENAMSAQIRYATRRLHRKVPNAFIVTALVRNKDEAGNAEELAAGNSGTVKQCALAGNMHWTTTFHQAEGAQMDDTEERIRQWAYRLWYEEGCPEGRELVHWEKARELVAKEDSQQSATDSEEQSPNSTDTSGKKGW